MNFNHPPDGFPPMSRNPTERMKDIELGLAPGRQRPDKATEAAPTPADAEKDRKGLTKDELKDVLDKTLEVVDLLSPRRHLEYEVIEEANVVQVQVVNTDDGSIVRKIPSDDIIKLVEQIHQMLGDRFEVEA